jgi:hypothetical protein
VLKETSVRLSRIGGCRDGEVDGDCLLGCNALYPGRILLAASISRKMTALVMEVVSTSETSVNFNRLHKAATQKQPSSSILLVSCTFVISMCGKYI